MGSTFHPDYGLFAKENFNTDLFFFYGLQTDHVMRVDYQLFSIFTSYEFDGVTYALSLNFGQNLLAVFLNILSPYFSENDFDGLISKLTDPEFKYKIVEWNEPICDFSCKTKLGEIQPNQNEYYIPFIIQEFI